ncbi:MerC domain-containing protein [Sphingomonas sp. CCH9-E2]|uniref:MerC domain-containing protein n=2 Tax=unclassified Sphingomonas TaxID=196159 RepID=UPI0008325911|nr:MerC domain-containing protein [Sphingomonas sp. CCH9-E2]
MRARLVSWFDGLAVGASVLCLIHCLALPIVIAALPALAARLDLGEGFHLGVLAFALPVSAVALGEGWRRHRGLTPLFVGAAGLVLLAAGLAFEEWVAVETGVTVAGSLLLAGAHVANWRGRGLVAASARGSR